MALAQPRHNRFLINAGPLVRPGWRRTPFTKRSGWTMGSWRARTKRSDDFAAPAWARKRNHKGNRLLFFFAPRPATKLLTRRVC